MEQESKNVTNDFVVTILVQFLVRHFRNCFCSKKPGKCNTCCIAFFLSVVVVTMPNARAFFVFFFTCRFHVGNTHIETGEATSLATKFRQKGTAESFVNKCVVANLCRQNVNYYILNKVKKFTDLQTELAICVL